MDGANHGDGQSEVSLSVRYFATLVVRNTTTL